MAELRQSEAEKLAAIFRRHPMTGITAPAVTEEPEEPEFAGTRQCGHDDYHDAHEWADLPHIWCPGHSLTEEPGR
ncbi:hypothetical protein ACIOHO_15620 [Streptomyces sp. NPDC087849]